MLLSLHHLLIVVFRRQVDVEVGYLIQTTVYDNKKLVALQVEVSL